jgi:hypothetical protein
MNNGKIANGQIHSFYLDSARQQSCVLNTHDEDHGLYHTKT